MSLVIRKILAIFIILTAIVVSGLIFGCARPSVSDERAPGRTAYLNNCGSCHRRPTADSKTDKQWLEIIKDHQDKASLNKATLKLVSDYLQANN